MRRRDWPRRPAVSATTPAAFTTPRLARKPRHRFDRAGMRVHCLAAPACASAWMSGARRAPRPPRRASRARRARSPPRDRCPRAPARRRAGTSARRARGSPPRSKCSASADRVAARRPRSSHSPASRWPSARSLVGEHRVRGLAHERVAERRTRASPGKRRLAARRRSSSRATSSASQLVDARRVALAAEQRGDAAAPEHLAEDARRAQHAPRLGSSASRRACTIASTVSGSASPLPSATARISSSR